MIAVDRQSTTRSLTVPLIVGGAAAGGLLYWYLRDERKSEREVDGHEREHVIATPGGPPPPPSGRWVFPLPRWQGRDPVVSDGYGSPRIGDSRGTIHRGADIMYRRRALAEFADVYPPRAPHSRWHFMPPGTLVLAAADGEVWSAGYTPTGHSVVLSHGSPWATYYTHMASLHVSETAKGRSKQRVRAGQPLGVVGASPKDQQGIAHLHFEMWFRGDGRAAIDPVPYLRQFNKLDAPEVN